MSAQDLQRQRHRKQTPSRIHQKNAHRFETTAEYERFIACYSDAPIRAMRINTLKISKERFLDLCPWRTKQSELLNEGLILTENPEHIGTHPYHIAGLFYMQEPSAMSVVEAAEIAPGMRVLDLCAAPGGKAEESPQGFAAAEFLFQTKLSRIAQNCLPATLSGSES